MNILENMSTNQNDILPQIILIIILTLLNAFFASAELAVLSVNKTKMNVLAEKGNKKAIRVLKLNSDQTKFLSTIQVGITLAGFFSSATAATSLSLKLKGFLTSLGLKYIPNLSIIIITLFLSYITLVFGELFPKRIAIRFPDKVAMFVVTPISIIKKIVSPIVKFLSWSCNFLVKITGIEKNLVEEKISEEEIMSIIKTGYNDGVLSKDEKNVIDGIFSLDELTAKQIMTHRVNTFALDINSNLNDILDQLSKEKYTRVPIYNGDIDHIIGILNVKDILFSINKIGFENIEIKQLLRKPIYIPEHYNIQKLLKKFINTNNQMAIVIDEFGGFMGIITLEDIIEELLGNINDEYDDESFIKKINDNEYILNGNMNISDINRELNLNLTKNEDHYLTIGGLIINILGYIPKDKSNINIKYENLDIYVLKIKKNRIIEVKIKIN